MNTIHLETVICEAIHRRKCETLESVTVPFNAPPPSQHNVNDFSENFPNVAHTSIANARAPVANKMRLGIGDGLAHTGQSISRTVDPL